MSGCLGGGAHSARIIFLDVHAREISAALIAELCMGRPMQLLEGFVKRIKSCLITAHT